MRQLSIICIAVLLAAMSYLLYSNYSVSSAEAESYEAFSGGVFLGAQNTLHVTTQKPGNRAYVESAFFQRPGFIVIHENYNGVRGRIITASKLMPKGENKNISIPISLESGKSFFAALREDNGDGIFRAVDDMPFYDGFGNSITVRFETTSGVTAY